jgi:DNA-binding IclR family transcriptional regulator
MSQSSPSVERVVSVLNFFAEHPGQSFTFTDIVRALKLGRATCHALLTALAEARYLYRNADKSYVIGPALVELGQIAHQHFSPLQAAQPEMRVLADEFDAICSAVFLEQDAAVVKARAMAKSHLAWSTPPGSRLPLRAPFGAVFYSRAGKGELEQWLERLTPPATERERLELTRAMEFNRKFGFSFGERNYGVKAHLDEPEKDFSGERAEYPASVLGEIETDKNYDLAFIAATPFDKTGRPAFALVMTGFLKPVTGHQILIMGLRVRSVCDNLSTFLSSRKASGE